MKRFLHNLVIEYRHWLKQLWAFYGPNAWREQKDPLKWS